MKPRIVVRDLGKKFGRLEVLDSISLEVKSGEFISIVGPSGCGKTTLLFLMQGFLEPMKGTIEVDGKTGFVFQDNDLFPWKTVKENIEIGPRNSGKSESEIKGITKRLLKEFELIRFEDNYPHQISGGMKKRVSIARCLANNPQIIFMDEPFSSLDYLTRIKAHDFVSRLLKRKRITAVLVTHDIDEALKLSDRIVVFSDRPARINGIVKLEGCKKYQDSSSFTHYKKRVLHLIEN